MQYYINIDPTIAEAIGKSHHVDWDGGSIGTMEHSLLCQFGVKGNLPEGLEVERIEKDQAGLISQ